MSEGDETVEVNFDRVMGVSNSVAGDILSVLWITLVVGGLYLSAVGVAIRVTGIYLVAAAIPATIGGLAVIICAVVILMANYITIRGTQVRLVYTPGVVRSEAENGTQELVRLIEGSYVVGFGAIGVFNGTISLGVGLLLSLAPLSGLFRILLLSLSILMAILDFYIIYLIVRYVDWPRLRADFRDGLD